MDELESLNGELTPQVREILDFLRRRNEGKHGRYLEGKRSAGNLAAAVAEVAPAIASPPTIAPVPAQAARHEHGEENGNGNGASHA
jgi:hypothetical protein